MPDAQIAWVTHAPADYVLVFVDDPSGDHAVVRARCRDAEEARDAATGLEGAELIGAEVRVYCTLPEDVERTVHHLSATPSVQIATDRGTLEFVAVGDGSGTTATTGRDDAEPVGAHLVVSTAGVVPRCYRLGDQCERCGEFHGKAIVLPRGGVMLDTRILTCRCDGIPCRYCHTGTVRRPMTEHFDPERRAGHMPWFGYLVPCGRCQAAGRGPRVIMSHPEHTGSA